MFIAINDKQIEFPNSLADITLSKRIEFHNDHLAGLEDQLIEISKMEDCLEKDLLFQDYHDEVAMRFVAFYSGCSIESIKEYAAADLVLSLYHTVYSEMLREESEIKIINEFFWNNEKWLLQSPTLNQHHPMTFGELMDSKQILKDLIEDKASRWDVLLRVCCIFLRRENEQYSEKLLEDNGERMKLMLQLPMDIAVAVGFFLTSSINMFKNALAASRKAKEEAERI